MICWAVCFPGHVRVPSGQVAPTVSEALLQGILVACKTKSNALTQESLQPLTYFPHVLLSEHKGQG